MDGSSMAAEVGAAPNAADDLTLAVGTIVQVEARTWPGINKPGGVGRITQLHYSKDGKLSSVDVRYTVVGGRERRVPIQHIQAVPEFDVSTQSGGLSRNQLRDRSGLLGRCKRCGSLRADCGSCDWFEQERLVERARNQPEHDVNTDSQERMNRSKPKRQRIAALEEESLSSSSEEDEEQIKAENLRRRRYNRQKADWLRIMGDEAASKHKERQMSHEESSLDSDDSILARIADLKRSRREEKKRKLAKKYSKSTRRKRRKRRLKPGMSSLESLKKPEAPPFSTEATAAMPERRAPQSPYIDDESPAMSSKPQSQNESMIKVDYVGDPDVLSQESLALPPDEEMEETPNARGRPGADDVLDASMDLEGLGFIQPEGEDAAEHLPSDIVDRTQGILFKQLPSFFDDLLKELTNEIMPDAVLELAEFQQKRREARESNDYDRLHQLKEEGSQLYHEIQRKVIKDGIDQCCEAMRRMTNLSQRRRLKKEMTVDEWKHFRSAAMEARDTRLDLVTQKAEDVLRKAGAALLDDFRVTDEADVGDDELSESSGQYSDESASILTQDLISSASVEADTLSAGGEDVPLSAFDPHMHATVVRTRQSSDRSDKISAENTLSQRKRRKRPRGTLIRDEFRLANSTSPRQAPSQHRRRRARKGDTPEFIERCNSRFSDQSHTSSEESSKNFEETHDEPPAPRQRRRVARLQPRKDIGMTGCHFPSASERQSDRVPVADRMQAFLDANSSNINYFDGYSDGPIEEPNGSGRQMRSGHRARRAEPDSRRMVASEDNPMYASEDNDLPQIGDEETATMQTNLSTGAFYRQLTVRKKSATAPAVQEPRVRRNKSLFDLCKTLLEMYKDSADNCASIFDDIVLHFREQTRIVHAESVEVFAALLHLLQEYGNRILLTAALSDARNFKHHLRLLVFAMNLVDVKVHAALRSDDGLAFKLFGEDNWKVFVEMIVLQMMDVIYARAQPVWWALNTSSLSGVIEKLIPLRDTVGKLVPLVEVVSHCILEKFQCQNWRKLDDSSDRSFVSAVDPREYSSLLMTGSTSLTSPASSSVRYQSFNKALPRCEIETLWLLFGFFAESPSRFADGSKHRWRLIASMFGSSAGVLSTNFFESESFEKNKLPPPGRDHIKQCQEEMVRLAALVSSHALNPLPDSDTFLTKLVQKCLLLQTHHYRFSSNDANRMVLRNLDATDQAYLFRIWKASHVLNKKTAIVMVAYDSNGAEEESSHQRPSGQMTNLLSMSSLIESCANVTLVWIQQVPQKKARRSRLKQTLDKLVAECIDSASKLEASNGQSSQVTSASSFEEAFAIQTSSNGSLYAATAFREAAVRILVIAAISGSHETSFPLIKCLRETIWGLMADSGLKERQQRIISREELSHTRYGGDLIRSFSTARTMAWLANLHFSLLDGMQALVTLSSLPEDWKTKHDQDESMLVFLASCLAACLDCACDMFDAAPDRIVLDEEATSHFENVSVVISCICLWLAQLCINSRVALHSSIATAEMSGTRLQQAAEELQRNVFGMLATPIRDCLLCLTNSKIHGENAEHALKSVLGLTRAVVGLASAKEENVDPTEDGMENTSAAQSVEQAPTDDLFGSMDDALFMNIDLGAVSGQGSNDGRTNEVIDRDLQAFRDLWTVLIDMTKLTKPSERFAVLPPTGPHTNQRACMTTPGRTIASNNIGEIGACLATLACLEKQDSAMIHSSLDTFTGSMKIQGWDARDDSDQRYFRSVTECFYSEVSCLSGEYEQCNQLVRKRWDSTVEHFVDAMLDSNTLERFPSLNLKRIKDHGGARNERKQRLRLKLANSTRRADDTIRESVNEVCARLGKNEKVDSPGPAYNSSHLWPFCKRLGESIARSEDKDDSLANAFIELDSDLAETSRDTFALISLEKECIQRFKLFREILSYSAKHVSTGTLNFESLSNLIISCCCYQLYSISKGVHYQARFGCKETKSDTLSYKHARLLELQSCYVEMTVALLSWILRECPARRSTAFEATLQCVRDTLFSQVLVGKASDIHQCLQKVYSVATQQTVSSGRTRCSISPHESDESGVLNDIFAATVRRSREIVVHLALDQRRNGMRNAYCLLNSFVTLATSCNDKSTQDGMNQEYVFEMLTRALDDGNPVALATSPLSSNTSPFQHALDEYMLHVANHRAADSQESLTMTSLRHVVTQQFLVPKLLKDGVSASQKKGILRLLSTLLQIEGRTSATNAGLEANVVASAAKGIASCIRSALESPVVDDDLMYHALQCSRFLLVLPHLSEDSSQPEDSVLNWSRHAKDDTSTPPYALYLWTFATWLNYIGKMIVGRTNQERQIFEEFRSKATSLVAQGRSIWSDKDISSNVLEVSVRFVALEAQVFVEKENTLPVTNVYAKSKPKPTMDVTDSVEWTPSSSVRRAAKELQAKVIAFL